MKVKGSKFNLFNLILEFDMYSNLLLKAGKNQIYLVLNFSVSMSRLKISSLSYMIGDQSIQFEESKVAWEPCVMFRLENLPSEPILRRIHLLQKEIFLALLARFSCFFEASNWSKLLLPKYLWCPKDNHHICIVEILPKIQDFIRFDFRKILNNSEFYFCLQITKFF